MLSVIAATAVLAVAPAPVENVKLTRKYAADESHTFALNSQMTGNGAEVTIDAEIVFKVQRLNEKGAQLSMSAPKFKMVMDGEDTGQTGPDALLSDFNSEGIPEVMSTQDYAWIYILAASAGFAPKGEVAVGKPFQVEWDSKDKSSSVKGTGKLTELLEKDGKKVAKIEYELEVSPNDPTPGKVRCVTYLEQGTAAPISCEGTVEVEGGMIKFNVKRTK